MNEFRCLLPDRNNNLMSVYREFSGIDYRDIEVKGAAATVFFPGCTLMTYAPELTREVYAKLQDSCGCEGMLVDCCGKPLSQIGLPQRAADASKKLLNRIQEHNISHVVAGCPGCYYDLREILQPAGVTVQTVYEVIDFPPLAMAGDKVCTIHDSCPDRFEGIFGRQVRDQLIKGGFSITEMAHNRQNTICCGGGGMISRFRPDLAEQLVKLRLDAFQQSGADFLVGYCISCVSKFAVAANGFSVAHALSLLLGRHEDFPAARQKMNQMLDGPQGAEIWAKIMAD